MSEDDWLEAAMPGDPQGHGRYPLSFNLGWHGGIHLQAPQGNDGQRLPVRSIADGTVVYVRQPDAPNDDPQHPLNYGDVSGRPVWTSNGCVVIRHVTEIGVNAEGVATTVTFFSVYMHLHAIRPTVQQNRPIYRKDEIGDAGHIYGEPHLLHFEILCDDTNVQSLVGRSAGDLNLSQNGRIDAIYGDIHFRLPTGSLIYAQRPAANVVQPAVGAAYTAAAPLFVSLRYAAGDGAAGNCGDAYLRTYHVSGEVVGDVLEENDGEYGIYTEAGRIVTAYRNANSPQVPSPSAVYELLRFGRTIGTDQLTPANTPHWRQIRYPGGQGWVNLNAADVSKFSDSDFPHWIGWQLVDDSADQDSRCDSSTIRTLLDANNDGRITPQEATARLGDVPIQDKLAHVIAKYPTEWDAASFDHRWGWLRTSTAENPEPLTEDDFSRLRSHLEALSFWQGANLGIPSSHWHFHPKAFIRHFRKCGWLSVSEFARCIPRRSLSGVTNWNTAHTRSTTHSRHLNEFFRKYLGACPKRYVHALAQIYIETGLLALMNEGGAGANHLYGAFYGRGYKQLTWAGNYKKYGAFKAIPDQANPVYGDARITATSTHAIDSGGQVMRWAPRYDPAIVSNNLTHAAESSGFYWVTKTFRGTRNMNRVADLSFSPTSVAFNCWLINGGGNGYAHRQQFAKYLADVLLDSPPLAGSVQFTYPPLTPPQNPSLCQTFPPTEIPYTLNGTVHYDRQVP
ncbi:peptidase M23-like protein [Paucimonas lemoignei]|uniref:Peptidase M23-like protein n=1 Tax=Paucimonas lemoignei TaxID=29443 RepID=A0A4R3HP18_PAULE|nr:M23 family metallopeptidase [Paucimonas lemoignei]TCS32894.1 peptidase M23-like protein [Paucimonas lemoignei]